MDTDNQMRAGDGPRMGWWQIVKACSGTAADRRNQYWFLACVLAWALSFVAATWILKIQEPSGAVAWPVALAPNVFGVAAIVTYLRFLRMTDELVRQIQLEGLAWGFGGGVIFAMGYGLFEHAGAPRASLGDVVLVMMIAWSVGQLGVMGRYR